MAEKLNSEMFHEEKTKLSYKEILGKISQTSQMTSQHSTGTDQKEKILDFICEKGGLEKEMIPTETLAELKQTVINFHSSFVKKYQTSRVSRKMERILSDKWSENILKLPDSYLSLIASGLENQVDQTNEEEKQYFPESHKPRKKKNVADLLKEMGYKLERQKKHFGKKR